jgi:hypothetical protein
MDSKVSALWENMVLESYKNNRQTDNCSVRLRSQTGGLTGQYIVISCFILNSKKLKDQFFTRD